MITKNIRMNMNDWSNYTMNMQDSIDNLLEEKNIPAESRVWYRRKGAYKQITNIEIMLNTIQKVDKRALTTEIAKLINIPTIQLSEDSTADNYHFNIV